MVACPTRQLSELQRNWLEPRDGKAGEKEKQIWIMELQHSKVADDHCGVVKRVRCVIFSISDMSRLFKSKKCQEN